MNRKPEPAPAPPIRRIEAPDPTTLQAQIERAIFIARETLIDRITDIVRSHIGQRR